MSEFVVDLDRGYVVSVEDMEQAPITESFDADGDDCDLSDAVSVVAGPFSFGWVSVSLCHDDLATVH
tara:strand:- start:237 stop:437 length:201 start_codon:yes stop_codon:yes gene_type:complete